MPDIEMEINWKEFFEDLDQMEEEVEGLVLRGMQKLGDYTVDDIRHTIETFVCDRGHPQGVDTGHFVNSIHNRKTQKGYGFKITDGVFYGIYFEYGTRPRWMPFYDRSGNITALGEWAVRKFHEIGFKVMGKRGKPLKKPKRAQKEDVLREIKGMVVQLGEMMPFRKGLDFATKNYPRIFEEEFNAIKESKS